MSREGASTTSLAAHLNRALAALPRTYPGPGGAIAVLRDSKVLARHAWGWADAEQRIAFMLGRLFRICCITKQFTCALVLDALPEPGPGVSSRMRRGSDPGYTRNVEPVGWRGSGHFRCNP